MSYYPPPQGQPPQAGFAVPQFQGGYGPPQPGGYGPPQPGGYGQPQPGGYGQPQPGGYGQPQAGGFGQPQPDGYGQPQGGYAPPQQGGYPPNVGYAPGPPGPYAPPGYSSNPQQDAYYNPGQGYGQPVTIQPGSQPPDGEWMPMLHELPNCPPGLAYLMSVSSLYIKQKVELLEAFTGFETKNKFSIKNSDGQKVYNAVEDSDCCTRCFCGPLRPFDMKILDGNNMEVIHLNRQLACDSCFFPCCLQKMEVSSPPGTLVGTVEQNWSILTPSFSVKDAAGITVLKIEGPLCTFSICGSVEFKVLSKDGQFEVGKISKQWSGMMRELFTDADFFGVSFPVDLDVRMKAVMIGAVFLIDAMFFEKKGNQERDGFGMF